MININIDDLKQLQNEYRARATRIEINPFGRYTQVVEQGIMKHFKDTLNINEHVSYDDQKRYYKATNKGYYGSGYVGNDLKKINPQEFWGQNQDRVGKGDFFGDSSVERYVTGGRFRLDLVTDAEMQPYPRAKMRVQAFSRYLGDNINSMANFMGLSVETVKSELQPYLLPRMPIMYYFRHGWVNPENSLHHMKKRPFGKWLAIRAQAIHLLGTYLPYLLKAAGFKFGGTP